MASNKEYVDFILEQCEGLTARAMMGEYVLYYGGKVVGGVYDNRLLVKPTPLAKKMMPDAPMELPYEGAKEMLLVEDMKVKIFCKVCLRLSQKNCQHRKEEENEKSNCHRLSGKRQNHLCGKVKRGHKVAAVLSGCHLAQAGQDPY